MSNICDPMAGKSASLKGRKGEHIYIYIYTPYIVVRLNYFIA